MESGGGGGAGIGSALSVVTMAQTKTSIPSVYLTSWLRTTLYRLRFRLKGGGGGVEQGIMTGPAFLFRQTKLKVQGLDLVGAE